nr:hypothetical protein GTC16762_33300 [Pigmentibacter ruber]
MCDFFIIQGNSVYIEKYKTSYFSFSVSSNDIVPLIEAIEHIDYRDCIKKIGWEKYIQKPCNFSEIYQEFENKMEELEDYLYKNHSIKK